MLVIFERKLKKKPAKGRSKLINESVAARKVIFGKNKVRKLKQNTFKVI